MYGSNQSAQTEPLICGTQIAGASVGQQGPAECRNQVFEIFHPGTQNQNRVVKFGTHCISCHDRDSMELVFTGQPDWQYTQQGQMVCQCGQGRFRLLEAGNEVGATCAHCNQRTPIGYTAGAMK